MASDRVKQVLTEFGLGKFVKPVKRFVKELTSCDPRRHATMIAKLKQRIDVAFAGVSEDEVRAGLEKVLATLAAPRNRKLIARALRRPPRPLNAKYARDGRAIALNEMIRDAEAAVPYSVAVFVARMDLQGLMRRMLEPADVIREARRSRGEVRARTAVRALREVAEMLYVPYLRFLWYLRDVPRDRLTTPPKFGPMVQILSRELPAATRLVEPGAGWMRNAASHASWRYLPEADSVVMWDRRVPHTPVPVAELVALVVRMYDVSGPIMFEVCTSTLMTRLLGAPQFIEMMLDSIAMVAMKELDRAEAIGARFEEWSRGEFAAVQAFFTRHGWVKRPTPPEAPRANLNGLMVSERTLDE